jgi:chemotaxis protein methyltransferase CheR
MMIRADNFAFVCQLLKQRAAIALRENKMYLVNARLIPVARSAGLDGADALIDKLRQSPDETLVQAVIDAMTTNETSFFRDAAPFDLLRDLVLPELVKHRAAERTIHIWSAGCSSGQEPYTIAMLWLTHFAHLSNWRVKLLATDISTEMLDRAVIGRYTELEISRGLPAEHRDKYFRQDGNHWQIDQRLRTMVEFRPLNLSGAWPVLPAMDVVLLRNVLVYFDAATKKQILKKIRTVLRPDGYLFLGGTETTLMIDDAFERVVTPTGSYYSLKDNKAASLSK